MILNSFYLYKTHIVYVKKELSNDIYFTYATYHGYEKGKETWISRKYEKQFEFLETIPNIGHKRFESYVKNNYPELLL